MCGVDKSTLISGSRFFKFLSTNSTVIFIGAALLYSRIADSASSYLLYTMKAPPGKIVDLIMLTPRAAPKMCNTAS